MFIKGLFIKNFRLFDNSGFFEIKDLKIPDGENNGSGLNVFVGENGLGKSTILDALALPLLDYKASTFTIHDLNQPEEKCEICLQSENEFVVRRTTPKGDFNAKGFSFTAGLRSKGNKSYLSSLVVTDQKFISGENEKPIADYSPDLRLSVNNPFSGKRFNENDILYLDKNRLFQVRSGTYNSTRFDRLMEDLSFNFVKSENNEDLNSLVKEKAFSAVDNNEFLESAISDFEEICGLKIDLDFLDSFHPFKNAFLSSHIEDTSQQIILSSLGSGYEMIFTFLYSFYLAQQSKKQLIVLIDEPELHLHPSIQLKFVEKLLELSESSQVFITTHSPLLVKQLVLREHSKIDILCIEDDKLALNQMSERVLNFVSANEINYLAFNLPTEEYHNELFEHLKNSEGESLGLKDFDRSFFQTEKGEPNNSPWKGHDNEVTIHTFLRNQIHHRAKNGNADYENLLNSIIKMREFVKELEI